MIEGTLDHRLRAGFAIALEEVTLERAGIDADPHRAAVVLSCFDYLADARGRADVAGVDAQAGGTTLRRLDRPLVVEMNIGDDRHRHLPDDFLQCQRGLLVGAGDPDNIRARLFESPDLGDRGLDIAGHGVGHRLHADRRIPADRHLADINFTALTALDVAIGPDAHRQISRG